MAIIEISIKSTYAPKWGTWECIREAMQNGLDEDLRRHKLTVKYERGWLTIHNEGADMETAALLPGETDKNNNNDLAGEHGEGLGLGFLAGVRAGYKIKVSTQTETWAPFIGPSKDFKGRKILKVKTRKLKNRRSGVTVAIRVPEEEWEKAQDLFLRFARLDREQHLIEIPEKGAIITDPAYAGRVYVKGIFVQHIPDLSYAYNLLSMKLDRDRRMVNEWELKWELATLHRQAIAMHPDRMVPAVYAMLRDDKKDTQGLNINDSSETDEAVAAQWIEEHGDKAVPVSSIGESSQVSILGHHGVVVNNTLKDILGRTHVPSSEKVQKELKTAAVRTYGWEDLTREEQDNLSWAAAKLDQVTGEMEPLLGIVNIVDFHLESLQGTQKDGAILLARKCLANKRDALTVLVHETAHEISGERDMMPGHTREIENLWSKLFWMECDIPDGTDLPC